MAILPPSFSSTFFYKVVRHTSTIAPDAAFPTAKWVAAMRAEDARSPNPLIGSNIGAGPDTLAAAFAGEEGIRLLEESIPPGVSRLVSTQGIVRRTLQLDAWLMAALKRGVKQFLLLAAGLDSRAWRLPLDKSIRVFEVDVPRAHQYKTAVLSTLPIAKRTPTCTRIAVEADLSQPNWPQTLLDAGYNQTEQTFVLCEGLLMYLPSDAPPKLLTTTARIVGTGSEIAGDVGVNVIHSQPAFLKTWGTQFFYELESIEAVPALFRSCGWTHCDIVDITRTTRSAIADANATSKSNHNTVEWENAAVETLRRSLLHFPTWPANAVHWLLRKLNDFTVESNATLNIAGLRAVVKTLADDKLGHYGLADSSAETKARIVENVIKDPFPSQFFAVVAETKLKLATESTASSVAAMPNNRPSAHVLFHATK